MNGVTNIRRINTLYGLATLKILLDGPQLWLGILHCQWHAFMLVLTLRTLRTLLALG